MDEGLKGENKFKDAKDEPIKSEDGSAIKLILFLPKGGPLTSQIVPWRLKKIFPLSFFTSSLSSCGPFAFSFAFLKERKQWRDRKKARDGVKERKAIKEKESEKEGNIFLP